MKYIFIFLIVVLSALQAEKIYYTTGELKKEVNYKNGKKHGLIKLYYKWGKLKTVREYRNGKRVDVDYYSTGIKATPTKVTNTDTKTELLEYGYKQAQNNHFYRAHLAYNEVCDSGNLNGCFYLGLSYSGDDRFILGYDDRKKAKVNGYPEEAVKMWGKECENGDMLACFDLGRLYLQKIDYKRTNGFYEMAHVLYKKACDNGEMKGCMGITGKNASYMKEKTRDTFIKNYTNACNNGELNGCYWLGRYYDDFQYFKKANIIFEKACNNGEMKSCHALALSYEQARGRKKDYDKANIYYKKACNNKYMFSCSTLTRIQIYLEEEKKTPSLRKKACNIGLSTACIRMGSYKKGCELGDNVACDMIETKGQ